MGVVCHKKRPKYTFVFLAVWLDKASNQHTQGWVEIHDTVIAVGCHGQIYNLLGVDNSCCIPLLQILLACDCKT